LSRATVDLNLNTGVAKFQIVTYRVVSYKKKP